MFNRRERNGLYLLLGLILLIQLISMGFKYFQKVEHPVFNITVFQDTISQQRKDIETKDFSKSIIEYAGIDNGFNHKSPKGNSNFKGTKEKPYFQNKKSNNFTIKKGKVKILKVEMNTADSIEIQKVRGIGPVLSKRIIKYRDMIGGFLEKKQLLDVYGLDEERYEQIKDQIIVDSETVQRLNIFSLSADSLSNHFFISHKNAKIIKAYTMETTNNSITETELLSLNGIWLEQIEKALPYLILEKEKFAESNSN